MSDVAPQAPVAEVPKLYPDEISMKEVESILGLSAMRVRTLTLTDKIPSAKKNVKGVWRFSRKVVEEFAKTRVRNARISDGRAWYKVRLNEEEAKKVAAALGPEFTLVKIAYNYQKKKAAKIPKPGPMPGLPK